MKKEFSPSFTVVKLDPGNERLPPLRQDDSKNTVLWLKALAMRISGAHSPTLSAFELFFLTSLPGVEATPGCN